MTTGWVVAITVAVSAAGILLRQAGIPKVFTIWAEDGEIFATCAYRDPSQLTCLGEVYGGYFHTVPRLGAAFAGLLPPEGLPIWLTIAATVVTAACAAVVSRIVFEVGHAPGVAIVAGGSVTLTYQAGREVGGNLANLHWILLVAAIVILVVAWGGRAPKTADRWVVGGAAFSSAFAPLLAGLAAVVALRRVRGGRPILGMTLGAVIVQIGGWLAHPRNDPVQRVIDGPSLLAYLGREIVGRGAFGGRSAVPDAAVWTGVLIVCLLLAILALRSGDRDARPTLAIVLSLAVLGLAVTVVSVGLNNFLGPRYGYVAATLAVIGLLGGAAVTGRLVTADPRLPLAARRLGRFGATAVAAAMVVGFGQSFRLEARASIGPDVVAEYRAAVGSCASGVAELRLVTAPEPASGQWFVTIPCSRTR